LRIWHWQPACPLIEIVNGGIGDGSLSDRGRVLYDHWGYQVALIVSILSRW
jgi:hypothetical protein